MVGLSGTADQFTHQHVLRVVGVLVLVDEHVTEAAAVVLGNLGKRLEKRNGLTDEIVEVECVRRTQPLLIVAVDLGDQSRQLGRILIGCDNRLFRSDEFVLQVGDVSGEKPRGESFGVELEVLRDHRQQSTRIVGIVDREIRVQTGQERRLCSQDAHATGVERRYPHGVGTRSDKSCHTLAHLGRSLVGERDGQDLTGGDTPFGQQIGDATRQHCRLARAGARDDQQRRTGMDHGLALLRVETLEEGVRTRAMSPRAAPVVLGMSVVLTECWVRVHRMSTLPASTDTVVSASTCW